MASGSRIDSLYFQQMKDRETVAKMIKGKSPNLKEMIGVHIPDIKAFVYIHPKDTKEDTMVAVEMVKLKYEKYAKSGLRQ